MQKEAKKLEVALTKLRSTMEAASAQRKALEQCVERARSAGAGATLSAAEVAQKKKLADQVNPNPNPNPNPNGRPGQP